MILEYVRDKNGRRVGYLLGTTEGIGWSKHHRTLDRFDRRLGFDIAEGRAREKYTFWPSPLALSGLVAVSEKGNIVQVHKLVAAALPKFQERYATYFK